MTNIALRQFFWPCPETRGTVVTISDNQRMGLERTSIPSVQGWNFERWVREEEMISLFTHYFQYYLTLKLFHFILHICATKVCWMCHLWTICVIYTPSTYVWWSYDSFLPIFTYGWACRSKRARFVSTYRGGAKMLRRCERQPCKWLNVLLKLASKSMDHFRSIHQPKRKQTKTSVLACHIHTWPSWFEKHI